MLIESVGGTPTGPPVQYVELPPATRQAVAYQSAMWTLLVSCFPAWSVGSAPPATNPAVRAPPSKSLPLLPRSGWLLALDGPPTKEGPPLSLANMMSVLDHSPVSSSMLVRFPMPSSTALIMAAYCRRPVSHSLG